jgi:hypothetical protein
VLAQRLMCSVALRLPAAQELSCFLAGGSDAVENEKAGTCYFHDTLGRDEVPR